MNIILKKLFYTKNYFIQKIILYKNKFFINNKLFIKNIMKCTICNKNNTNKKLYCNNCNTYFCIYCYELSIYNEINIISKCNLCNFETTEINYKLLSNNKIKLLLEEEYIKGQHFKTKEFEKNINNLLID